MKLDLSDVLTKENSEATKKASIDMEVYENYLGSFPLKSKEDFEINFVNVDGERLKVDGSTKVTVTCPCDRCLKDVDRIIDVTIKGEIIISKGEPVEIPDDEESVYEVMEFLEGTSFDVEEAVKNELLVNWPDKVLCKADCKGICPKCGKNLNEGSCDCVQGELDPRMAQFLDVFNSMNKEV